MSNLRKDSWTPRAYIIRDACLIVKLDDKFSQNLRNLENNRVNNLFINGTNSLVYKRKKRIISMCIISTLKNK